MDFFFLLLFLWLFLFPFCFLLPFLCVIVDDLDEDKEEDELDKDEEELDEDESLSGSIGRFIVLVMTLNAWLVAVGSFGSGLEMSLTLSSDSH